MPCLLQLRWLLSKMSSQPSHFAVDVHRIRSVILLDAQDLTTLDNDVLCGSCWFVLILVVHRIPGRFRWGKPAATDPVWSSTIAGLSTHCFVMSALSFSRWHECLNLRGPLLDGVSWVVLLLLLSLLCCFVFGPLLPSYPLPEGVCDSSEWLDT